MVFQDLQEQRAVRVPDPSPRFPALDTLRAIGLIGVVLFHVDPELLPGGYVGVDLFFVLSGFLITSLLLREHRSDGTIRLGRFAVRRARRLIPAAVVVVTAVTAAAALVGGDVLVGLPQQLLGIVTLTSNWQQLFAGSDYFAHSHTGLLDNFWSLAIEEQFYLVWPAILAFSLRKRGTFRLTWLLLAAVIAAAIPLALGMSGHFDAAYLATPAHAFGLILGATLALVYDRMPSPREGAAAQGGWNVAGLLALVALVAVASTPLAAMPTHRPMVTVVGSLLGGLLVLSAVRGRARVGAWMDGGPLGWLGRRSYGAYLWHLPLIVLADAALPQAPGFGTLPGRLIAVAFAVLAAAASYRWIETGIRRTGFRAFFRRPAACVLTGVVIVGLVGSTVAAVHRAPSESVARSAMPAAPGGSDASDTPAAPPDPGVEGSSVVAIGDSVMLASKDELQQEFPGITVDAVESRQLTAAADLVRSHLEEKPQTKIVVIGLGVNGVGGEAELDEAIEAAGDREVVLVDVSAPVAWESTVNAEIEQAAHSHPHVALADWRTQAQAHPDLLADDGIHPGDAGGAFYAASIASAIAALR
ncbi:membrane protein of unknown function [Agreia sp. COWG]|nr:membrane protein of unknown function [Agreia sp. COWG]